MNDYIEELLRRVAEDGSSTFYGPGALAPGSSQFYLIEVGNPIPLEGGRWGTRGVLYFLDINNRIIGPFDWREDAIDALFPPKDDLRVREELDKLARLDPGAGLTEDPSDR